MSTVRITASRGEAGAPRRAADPQRSDSAPAAGNFATKLDAAAKPKDPAAGTGGPAGPAPGPAEGQNADDPVAALSPGMTGASARRGGPLPESGSNDPGGIVPDVPAVAGSLSRLGGGGAPPPPLGPSHGRDHPTADHPAASGAGLVGAPPGYAPIQSIPGSAPVAAGGAATAAAFLFAGGGEALSDAARRPAPAPAQTTDQSGSLASPIQSSALAELTPPPPAVASIDPSPQDLGTILSAPGPAIAIFVEAAASTGIGVAGRDAVVPVAPSRASSIFAVAQAEGTFSSATGVAAGDAAAPGGAPAAPAGGDANPAALADRLSGQVVRLLASSTREAVIRLRPPELGQVTLRVAVSGRDVSAWFGSPQPGVQQAIGQAIAQLHTDLGNAGYSLNQAWVGADATDSGAGGTNVPLPAPRVALLPVDAAPPAAQAATLPASGVSIYV